MAFEVTTIQELHANIIALNKEIEDQAAAFAPLLASLSQHVKEGSPEASAVLSLQSFAMGLAKHMLTMETSMIRWMADEATLRDLDSPAE
jgi:hypothetical protein